MTTPYTMKDIMRFRKAAYLAARVSGDWNFELKLFWEEPKPFMTAFINRASFGDLAKYFKPYLEGITIEMMEEIYLNFYNEMKNRRREKDKFRPLAETGKRLYPLGSGAYEQFAKYVWEKRGKPYSQEGPLGAVWGGERTKDFFERTKFGNRNLKHVACEIITNLRGKKILILSIANR